MLKEEKRIGYEREEGWLEIERKERGRDWKDEKRARVEESDKNRQSSFATIQYLSNFILMYLYIPTIFQLKYKTKNTKKRKRLGREGGWRIRKEKGMD